MEFLPPKHRTRIDQVTEKTRSMTADIRGPWGSGATAAVSHFERRRISQGRRCIHIDMQRVAPSKFAKYGLFLTRVSEIIIQQVSLGRPYQGPPVNAAFTRYLEGVLSDLGVPVVLVMTHLELLFATSFGADWLSMVRRWEDAQTASGARSPIRPWPRTDIVLMTAGVPGLLALEPFRSPFNRGIVVECRPQGLDETRAMNRGANRLLDDAQLCQLHEDLHGNPTLLVRVFEDLQRGRQVSGDSGPVAPARLSAAMRRVLVESFSWLSSQPDLVAQLRRLQKKPRFQPRPAILQRLLAAGLVYLDGDRVRPTMLIPEDLFAQQVRSVRPPTMRLPTVHFDLAIQQLGGRGSSLGDPIPRRYELYELQFNGSTTGIFVFPWGDGEWHLDLHAFHAGELDIEACIELGQRLRQVLLPAGWQQIGDQLLSASFRSPVAVHLSLADAALYPVPWKHAVISNQNTMLGEVSDLRVSYRSSMASASRGVIRGLRP